MLTLPFNNVFDYQADDDVKLGDIVRVSFGREQVIGAVWKIGKSCSLEEAKIKPISERYSFPPLSEALRKFVDFVAQYNMAFAGLVLKMVLSVRSVFDDPKTLLLYKLSGKTLAEAKIKNSDARWRVMDFLKFAPFTRSDICKGAGVTMPVVNKLIEAGVLEAVAVEDKWDFLCPNPDTGTTGSGRRFIIQNRWRIFCNVVRRRDRLRQDGSLF